MHSAFKLLLLCIILPSLTLCWKDKEAILLREVETLSLYAGRKTTGRRSSPVAQLKCIGGSAGCNAVQPKVVQCYNRGWDGQDVQWECKAEMDKAYEFGQISVTCEGYSYPDDPYILKGSCGLEYTIDYTRDANHGKSKTGYYNRDGKQESGSTLANIVVVVAVISVIYALYVTCFGPQTERVNQYSSTNDDQRPGGGFPFSNLFGGTRPRTTAPPPPGFHPSYASDSASCGPAPATGGSSMGGFWTGAATGGLLGYMLGNRGSGENRAYSRRREPDYSNNSNWGGTSSSGFYEQRRETESTGDIRETSGFGGTTRR